MEPLPALLPEPVESYVAEMRELATEVINQIAPSSALTIAAYSAQLQQKLGRVPSVSSAMPLASPSLMAIYTDAVRELERSTADALVALGVAHERQLRANDVLQKARAGTYSALLKQQVAKAAAPGGPLQRWAGDKPAGGRGDLAKTGAALQQALVAAAVSAAETTTRAQSPRELLRLLADAENDARGRLDELLRDEWPRRVQLLVEYSSDELLNVLPRYGQRVAQIVQEFQHAYEPLLRSQRTLKDARDAVTAQLVSVMDALARTFDSYRADAPLVPASAQVPGVPTKRDYSALYATPEGAEVVPLYEAARQLLPAGRSADWAFLSQIPRNSVMADTQVLLQASPEPLQRLQRYMEARTLLKTALREAYTQLAAVQSKR